jgi:hypothetical protein
MRNPNSAMAQTFGGLVGVGPGAGMSLIMIGSGVCTLIVVAVAVLVRAVRDAESILPDHVAVAEPAS